MDPKPRFHLDNFIKSPGSTVDAIKVATVGLFSPLPHDYIELLHIMDGGEGFVGSTYVRFYPSNKLALLNKAYAVEEFAPGLVIFGSNGGGEAFAFDNRQEQQLVVQIPFIP